MIIDNLIMIRTLLTLAFLIASLEMSAQPFLHEQPISDGTDRRVYSTLQSRIGDSYANTYAPIYRNHFVYHGRHNTQPSISFADGHSASKPGASVPSHSTYATSKFWVAAPTGTVTD